MLRTWKPFAWAPVLTLVTAGALLALPRTRWVFAEQLRLQARPSPSMAALLVDMGVREIPGGPALEAGPRPDQALLRAARRHPNDVGAQLVLADEEEGAVPGPDRALQVAHRFPNRPEGWAWALRRMSGRLHLGRDQEQDALSARPPGGLSFAASPASAPGQWRAALDVATAGEQSAPDNAFFPTMRAVALLGLKRDDEAVSALHRAAACARWDDYVMSEVEWRLRLQREALGRRGTVPDLCVWAAALMPHYAQMRAGARLLVVQAVRDELAGKLERGLAIRHDLMRVAAVQRADSRCELGSQVGSAMTAIAVSRPGGAPATVGASDAEVRFRERRAAYARYLNSLGRSDEAAWASAQLSASRQVRQVITGALPLSVDAGAPVRSLIAKWIVGFGLTALALWFIAVGLLSQGLAAAMSGSLRWWIAAVLGLGLLAAFTLVQTANARLYAAYPVVIDNLTGTGAAGAAQGAINAGMSQLLLGLVRMVMPAALIGVPLLVAGVAALVAGLQRKAVLATMGKTLVVAGLLFTLADAWLVVGLAGDEDRASVDLARMMQHQGRYRAALVHQQWPAAEPPTPSRRGSADAHAVDRLQVERGHAQRPRPRRLPLR